MYLGKGGGAATHFKDATQIRVQHASSRYSVHLYLGPFKDLMNLAQEYVPN